eukprot:COSAG05_NODE_977_length_6332_cov_10.027755_11_plen_96_part_00
MFGAGTTAQLRAGKAVEFPAPSVAPDLSDSAPLPPMLQKQIAKQQKSKSPMKGLANARLMAATLRRKFVAMDLDPCRASPPFLLIQYHDDAADDV